MYNGLSKLVIIRCRSRQCHGNNNGRAGSCVFVCGLVRYGCTYVCLSECLMQSAKGAFHWVCVCVCARARVYARVPLHPHANAVSKRSCSVRLGGSLCLHVRFAIFKPPTVSPATVDPFCRAPEVVSSPDLTDEVTLTVSLALSRRRSSTYVSPWL